MQSPSVAAAALIDAYNRKDFDALEQMISPALDFAHYNRNFVLSSRDELLAVLREFAANYMVTRHFDAPERVTEAGDTAVLESWYAGTLAVDLPGFGKAGEDFRLKFCSVMRFDPRGILLEWKDYG